MDDRTKSRTQSSFDGTQSLPAASNSAFGSLFRQDATGRRHQTVQRGSILFSEEDRPDGAYLMVSGRIKLSRLTPSGREVLLDLVEPGDIFGLQDVLVGTPRRATAAALTDCHVIRVSPPELEDALRNSPRLVRDLLQMLLRRMGEMERRVEALMTQTVPRRLGYTLLELARADGNGGGDYVVLTHQDLGNLVGTSRETVSLFLARFRQNGWVATERGRIRILNSEGLKSWLEKEEGIDETPSGAPAEPKARRLDRRASGV